MRALGRVAAIALLLCIPLSFMNVYRALHRPGVAVIPSAHGYVVGVVLDSRARALGIAPGDAVDLRGLSVGDRIRLISPPFFRPFSLVVVHGERRIVVPMNDFARAPSVSLMLFESVSQGSAIGGLLLGAIILWRRPGPIALAFGLYTLNFLYALPTSEFFSFLTDPLLSAAVIAANVLVATVPQLALVAFALRFPGPLSGRAGFWITRGFDAMLVALGVLAAFRVATVPTLYDLNDPWLDTAPSVFLTASLVAIVLVRYARTRGENRRRLGWVAVGSVASAIGTVVGDLQTVSVLPTLPWSGTAAQIFQDALPVAFAYAILRHHVLDLGFAINRTLVYSAITGTLVVAVGAIDWVSGKMLGNSHLSAFLEAAVTIALGAALSWFHNRVERTVDRILFRRRYLAATRIESRIAALGFATKTEAVDEALVAEVIDILHVGSAAVFRRAETSAFVCVAAVGWEGCAAELPLDHLLLRTLRAEERAVEFAVAGIADADFPSGRARPDIAIPIVVRHEFFGFAIYGHRADDAGLDPQERDMLVRLVAAAAQAYDAIDAADWRRRALALQALPALTGP